MSSHPGQAPSLPQALPHHPELLPAAPGMAPACPPLPAPSATQHFQQQFDSKLIHGFLHC